MKKSDRSTTVTTKEDVTRFRRAAAAYASRATKSKATARKALVDLGIYTRSGQLTKNYK